jgi:hypothetical protein
MTEPEALTLSLPFPQEWTLEVSTTVVASEFRAEPGSTPEAAPCVDSCRGSLDSSNLAPKADSQDGKEWWKRLAVFKHQPTFAADEPGTHLVGQALHTVKNSFLFGSLGKLSN